jgi:four helix bundle protein
VKDLQIRTRKFALRIVRLFIALPKSTQAQVLGKQILRSGTSVGANYAESCRARSDADFLSKHQVCLQELEETLFWLDLMTDSEILKKAKTEDLRSETEELISIFVTIIKKTKARTTK